LKSDIAGDMMNVVRPAYVLDTDVMVAATRSRKGASRQLLIGALDNAFDVLLSVPLLLEYEAVLTREEHMFASQTDRTNIEKLLNELVSVARLVPLVFRWRPLLTDPGDDMVLETAINGHALAIVTFNLRHFECVGRWFGTPAIQPRQALALVRGIQE
jgi:putative PIN family toxin of toxin-antitoxin system